MGKQGYSILELTRNNILSFKSYLPTEKLAWIRRKDVGALGLIKDEKIACGALMYCFYPEEGTAFLESICIDETLRGQGLGSLLYEEFENKALEMGIEEIGARIVLPLEDDAESFLITNGFDRSEVGERFYAFTKEDIMAWLMNPKVESVRKSLLKDGRKVAVSLSKAPADVRKIMPDIPYDPEISYVFDGKEKKNYSLAKKDDAGNIIIYDILLDMNDAPQYFLFLEAVMAMYANKLSGEEKLYVTITSDRQDEILRSLSFKDEFEYLGTVNLAKAIQDKSQNAPQLSYRALVIPRINGVSKMLSDFGEGYEHTVAYAGDEATINILRGEGKPEVYLSYEYTGGERADSYTLSMITCFNKKELSEEQICKLTKWKEDSAMCSFAEDEDGRIFARAALIETEGLVNPDLLKTVIDGFMNEIDNMCGYILNEEV